MACPPTLFRLSAASPGSVSVTRASPATTATSGPRSPTDMFASFMLLNSSEKACRSVLGRAGGLRRCLGLDWGNVEVVDLRGQLVGIELRRLDLPGASGEVQLRHPLRWLDVAELGRVLVRGPQLGPVLDGIQRGVDLLRGGLAGARYRVQLVVKAGGGYRIGEGVDGRLRDRPPVVDADLLVRGEVLRRGGDVEPV